MKRILLKSTLLLILFILANLYFAVFNWKIFTVKLNINLGFGTAEFPPFIVLFLIGFVLLGIMSWANYNIRLRKMIYDLEHGVEMGKMKDRLDGNRIRKLILEDDNLTVLREKLGIREIQKKQEEIAKILADLKGKPEK